MAIREAPVLGTWLTRGLLFAAGLAFAANACWLAVMANFTLGTALVLAVALGLLVWAIWFPALRGRRWLNLAAIAVTAVVVAFSCFLATVGNWDTVDYDEQAVIVLGAAVHGREPSVILAGRLDRAVAYHHRNPTARIVVSGGQGAQEDVPEAVAMRDYLLARGVASDRIVLEPLSTSTEENFRFSKAALAVYFRPGMKVAFITDDFHVYRAERIAVRAGLSATHLSSKPPWFSWAANYLRESVAVLADWFAG